MEGELAPPGNLHPLPIIAIGSFGDGEDFVRAMTGERDERWRSYRQARLGSLGMGISLGDILQYLEHKMRLS